MAKFPMDVPIEKAIRVFEKYSSTLRTVLTQSGVSRDEILDIYERL